MGLLTDLMMIQSCTLEVWPCKNLLERLTSLKDTDVDPFEEIPEDEVSLEGVLELTMDPDNSNEDEGVAPFRILIELLLFVP